MTGYRDVEDIGPSQTDVSFGRYKLSTGNYNFVALSSKTPNALNTYPKVGPIVINEIMYNPVWPESGSYSNDEYEYIELKNIGSTEITLYDANENLAWRFTDGVDYTFPISPTVKIAGGGYIVVVRNKTAFSSRYPSVSSGRIYGPYRGHLRDTDRHGPGNTDRHGIISALTG